MNDTPHRAVALADPGTFKAQQDNLSSRDPLGYPKYTEALASARERSGSDESVTTGAAEIGGHPVELALFDFSFMGGSMGEVTGERLARAMERATERGVPFVLRTSTGGARMQEGMRSLIQMPKVVAARMALADAHLPFVAVLGHPTTGGVLAGPAGLADITIAEEDATIGFAGPRVAERVTGRPLPAHSHTAAFARDNGMVDKVVSSTEAAATVAHALECLAPDRPETMIEPLEAAGSRPDRDAWASVELARKPRTPTAGAWDIAFGLCGDRAGDGALSLSTHLVRVGGRRCMVIDTAGHPLWPSSFRKAIRCVEMAGRLGIPIVTLVDTPGADPSVDSEQQGVAWLIPRLTESMLAAPVPILSVVTGVGGSGGALAFATGDVLVAYESSIFSVIGPEAAAEILWRDAGRAPEAAAVLKLTAHDLESLGIADQVVAGEPDAGSLQRVVTYHLDRMPAGELSQSRRDRWRGTW